MKAGWVSKPFEDCIEKVIYTVKIQRKDFLDEGKFPIVSQEESFINGYWNDTADVFSVTTPIVIFGDHTKVLKYVDFDFVLGADGVKLLPPKGFLLPRFFYYQLQSVNLDSLGYARHYKLLRELELCYPPLPEQQRIVTLLDKAFDGIATAKANAEKNLQNARELFGRQAQAMLNLADKDWERVTLSDLLERGWIVSHLDGNHGGDYPRKEEFVDSGVPYISAKALKDGQVDFDESKYLSVERAAIIRKGLAKDRDVLFAHNATVGPVAILSTDEDVVILGTSLTYYRCDQKNIHPEYLAHFMRSPPFVSQYTLVMGQSTRNQVPITKQREFFHVIPPFAEQMRIASNLDILLEQIERLEATYQQKLTALNELKKSLLHRAFNGDM